MSPERRRTPGRRASDQAIAPIDVQDAFVALTDGILLEEPRGSIVSANPAAFRILGEDGLVGKHFDALLRIAFEPRHAIGDETFFGGHNADPT